MNITINRSIRSIPPEWRDQSLLDVLRDHLGLTGTKFGCGIGACGACTVHLDGTAVRACITPVQAAVGRTVTTIEGLADGDQLHPVQQAWIEMSVPQCGYCQPGQIMAASAFLATNGSPSPSEVAVAMSGNLCRCGTYVRIRHAVARAAELMVDG
ncbi:MAG: (2Fe-2S)-binding protein [Pseudomonadota bacterium]